MTAPQGQPVKELPNARYGENKDFEQAQQVSPAAQALQLPPAPGPSSMVPQDQGAPSEVTEQALPDLGDFAGPSERPGEPVTAGSPLGPGPTSLGGGPFGGQQPVNMSDTLTQYAAADPTGVIAALAFYLRDGNV